ncbi:thioredoxin domain-containing protein [Ectopseudomonas mendocina]|jgi:thiol-disulfide isomerase/thioredoxin|uniref:Thioredoxin n=1 Tax=Ectopseudomonas mendocina TaxID=300 RepID=A0A2R3QUA0_ECTME|nr:thioredoxin family protein [Pseudomonas mendocina]AVO55346.1 thioredoxin [Pseudomonas mendocina]
MNTDLECRQTDISESSIAAQLELTDLDADRLLLDLPGTSLLVFTSTGCASCRWARQTLPEMALPVERLCWVDAGHNAGLVTRYEVFHLPALFLVRDGQFLGALQSRLTLTDLVAAINEAALRPAEELP